MNSIDQAWASFLRREKGSVWFDLTLTSSAFNVAVVLLLCLLPAAVREHCSQNTAGPDLFRAWFHTFGGVGVAWRLLEGVTVEELLFRFLPLYGFLRWWPQNHRLHLGVSVLSSVVFGYLHGGWINVLLQGVGGFALCLQYLHTHHHTRSHPQALLGTIGAHYGYDAVLVGLALVNLR